MINYFTHYWKNDTCAINRDSEGEPLEHTAGNLFIKRGVGAGDIIYVITVKKGLLHILGKMVVKKIWDEKKANANLENGFWEAAEHPIASKGTRLRFNNPVSFMDVRKLLFWGAEGKTPPKFKKYDQLDQQTLRGVRKLTKESAMTLDRYCGKLQPCKLR